MKNKLITVLLVVIIVLLSCIIIDATDCMVYAKNDKVVACNIEQKVVHKRNYHAYSITDVLNNYIKKGWLIKEVETSGYNNHDWLIVLERKEE